MEQNYDRSLTEVLKSEGGYSNDAHDPGGPTNFGITIADYRRFIDPKGTALDVRRMTLAQAKTIYKKEYWDAIGGDVLPSGVDYCLFDYGVNSGIGRAKRVMAEFHSVTDPVKLINAICDERMKFLRSLRTWSSFGKGWSDRVNKVRRISLAMTQINHDVTPPVVPMALQEHHTRAWISFGQGGQVLDPTVGESQLVQRCKAIGVDTRQSPYQWNAIDAIVADIDSSDTKIIVGGDSLGANEAPNVASRTKKNIDLLFGFQPSVWGEHVQVPSNVSLAVCIYNPSWVETAGLGNYPWSLASGNNRTKLVLVPIHAPHPDDTGEAQDIVFKYIKELHT